MTAGPLLPREFFAGPSVEVAPALLGRVVVSSSPAGVVAVRLTEVEAYAGELDPGSHAYRGRTKRNAVMFGPPGHVYVYFTYGMHWCMNLVCGPVGEASAVLLRAGEVVEGQGLAASRRSSARTARDLARGPARMAVALGVDGSLDGADAVEPASPLTIHLGPGEAQAAVSTGPRVGVGGEGAPTPWRYWLEGDPSVSPYRAAVRRSRGGSTS